MHICALAGPIAVACQAAGLSAGFALLGVCMPTCCGTTQVKYIGYYETEEGAARAYDKAVVQTRGSAAQVREICS